MSLNTDLLCEQDRAYVTQVTTGTSLENTEAWIRWWSPHTVQIDGDLTLNELAMLTNIMTELQKILLGEMRAATCG